MRLREVGNAVCNPPSSLQPTSIPSKIANSDRARRCVGTGVVGVGVEEEGDGTSVAEVERTCGVDERALCWVVATACQIGWDILPGSESMRCRCGRCVSSCRLIILSLLKICIMDLQDTLI